MIGSEGCIGMVQLLVFFISPILLTRRRLSAVKDYQEERLKRFIEPQSLFLGRLRSDGGLPTLYVSFHSRLNSDGLALYRQTIPGRDSFSNVP